MTDSAGNVAWGAEYYPFGDVHSEFGSPSLNPHRFPGQHVDSATGLFENLHRDYVPGLGRYIQPDPIGLGAGGNLYAYVDGNPIAYVDPWGLYQRGDVIFRCNPKGECDVAMVWEDDTPNDDNDGNEELLVFGPDKYCDNASLCAGSKAHTAVRDSAGDPWKGYSVKCAYKPSKLYRQTRAEYERRLNDDWRRDKKDPAWTPDESDKVLQCYDLVNTLTQATRPIGDVLDGQLDAPKNLVWWRRFCESWGTTPSTPASR